MIDRRFSLSDNNNVVEDAAAAASEVSILSCCCVRNLLVVIEMKLKHTIAAKIATRVVTVKRLHITCCYVYPYYRADCVCVCLSIRKVERREAHIHQEISHLSKAIRQDCNISREQVRSGIRALSSVVSIVVGFVCRSVDISLLCSS
jgi:hypothetical protein